MMIRRLAVIAALACTPAAHAADFPSVGTLAQDEFHRLSQDLGAAFSYKGVTPATALGVTGFDIGLEITDTSIENSRILQRAGAGDQSRILVPKLHIHKGLFGGLDIGAFIATAPDVDAALFGGELRYAVVDDGLVSPAVGLRLSGSKATGTGDLKISTVSADVVVSKRFTAFTPYAGGGIVRIQSSVSGSSLAEEKFNKGRVFAGVNVNLLAINLAFEAEKMGDNTSLSAKVGWRF